MAIPEYPISRKEHYLAQLAGQDAKALPTYPERPISRIEQYLDEIVEHGGGGGTSDYPDLTNKPSINGVELSGDKSSSDLGLSRLVTAETNTTVNGYQVPELTAEQVTEIYNAIVAGENVIVIDATEKMYFQGINADVISDEIFISFRYFDKMLLEYDSNGNITAKLLDTYVVKSTMDSVAVAGAQYYLGEQSAVSIVLPDTAEIGQQISVVFYSGDTAATLSITGDTIGDIPTPAANQRVEINLLWDGTFWAIVSNVLAVPVEETI